MLTCLNTPRSVHEGLLAMASRVEVKALASSASRTSGGEARALRGCGWLRHMSAR